MDQSLSSDMAGSQRPSSHNDTEHGISTGQTMREEIGEREKLSKPRKHYGYPSFATWMASGNDLFPSRRFGAVNTRIILMMQDEITFLEGELTRLDQENRFNPNDIHNGSFRCDRGSLRETKLRQLRKACYRYSKSISRQSN